MFAKVFLFNTTIVTGLPPGYEPASYMIHRINAGMARDIMDSATEVVSAIGHDASAAALGAILGRPVAVNRIAAVQGVGEAAICLKLRGRLPEGQILTIEEMEAIGFDLYLMVRA